MKRRKVGIALILLICYACSAIAQTGPGGVNSPASNIVFWLRSDKGLTYDGTNNITTWTDQANSNDATNNSTATNPIFDAAASIGTNTEPGVLFTAASNEFLDLSDPSNNISPATTINARTMMMVIKPSTVGSLQYIYQQGDGSNGLFVYIAANGSMTFGINNGSSTYTVSSPASSISAGQSHIVSCTYNGAAGPAEISLTLDGVVYTNNTSIPTTIGDHNAVQIKIGSDASSSNYFNGYLGEIIYYDVVLNDGENRVVENYYSEKFGISIGANDHYSGATSNYRYNLVGIGQLNTESHDATTGEGGTVYLSENGAAPLANNDHIYVGHDNSNLSTTSADLTGILDTERYNRIWYLEKTGTSGAIIEFDIVESGLYTDVSGLTATDFSLLARFGTTGDFFQAGMVTSPVFNGNRIRFTLTNAEMASAYFTLGVPSTAKKWYVINSGDWSDTNTWTLDPAGAIYNNPDGLTPDTSPTAATDIVTILSGKTVTVGNGDISGTLTQLVVDGTLDFGSSTGHGTISNLEGSGVIRLSDDILPTITDASVFTGAGAGAGTVEYYGAGDVSLTSASGLTSFYNLVLNFNSNAQHLIVTSDIAINNNLTITQGDFQINDASTTRLVIDVYGDLTVAATGEISVGTGNIGVPTSSANYHDTFHRLNLYGNFTNNGVVNFSNLTGYAFDTFPTNGDAVTVRFTGQTDNTLTCNNTTNFYDFMLDKGTDQTYVLTVNPTAVGHFRVFGRNEIGNLPGQASNYLGKPIYIKNGTLELTGETFIPSMSEGNTNIGGGGNGSWLIPAEGALWINGPNVLVWGTCDDELDIIAIDTDLTAGDISGVQGPTGRQQSLNIIGQFRLTDGTYETRNGPGTFYSQFGSPELIIEGGSMDVPQLRNIGGTNANIVYKQTGGVLTFTGTTQGGNTWDTDLGIFDYESNNAVFVMSGGSIIFKDINERTTAGFINGININVPEGNYSVTGGTIEIDIDTDQLLGEGFEISFTPNFYNLTITEDFDEFVDFESDIVVSNDLILSSGTEVRMNGNNLTVGRNFNIPAGATYTQGGNNTTTFSGDASQTISLGGTYGDFYDVVASGTGLKTINSGDLTVSNSFVVQPGASFDNGNQDIIVQNTLTNSGTLQSTGTGALEFSGGSADYTVNGDGNGIFGNINLNDASNNVDMTADQAVTGTLTFSQNQILDINANQLTFEGASASISGQSNNRFIQLSGSASDGGLKMYVDANETLVFPIGTDANATVRYTPVSATFSNFPTADDGYVTISIADEVLTTTASGGGNALSYYWNVEPSDFTVAPTVQYSFTYATSDDDASDEANYVPGKVLSSSPFTRSSEIQGNLNTGSNTITFDNDGGGGFTLEEANYTAGRVARFAGAPNIYYSRQDGNFNTASTWSRNVQDGSGTQEVPTAGSIVVIQSDGAGDSHRVNTYGGINNLGAVIFDHDYTTYPDAASEDLPRLQFLAAGTYNLGLVSGTGMISFNATLAITANGDFGDFGENTDAYYLYFGGTSTLNNIPTPIPNLMVESATYTIDQNITTNANVVVQGNGTIIPAQDMTIGEDLRIGTWVGGTFQFPNSGSAVTVTVNGDIDFTEDPFTNPQDRDLIVADAAVDLEHTLILKGNIIHGAGNGHSFDLYNADNARPRVILELQGETDNNYARTSTSTPDLYRIVQNKGSDQTYSFTFNDDFTLSTPTATIQPIELQNGVLIINDTNIGDTNDIVLTNETNDTDFNIPSSATLQISAGTITVLGDDLGITLDGAIILDGTGILDMDGGNNNYIQYSSSGSASINLSGTAQLLVGSQIRESIYTSGGILSYNQAGGTAVIGNNTGGSPSTIKPMFAVYGTGSVFNFSGGTITISNHLSNASVASLYLDPDTYTVGTGTSIQFGDASTASGTEDLSIKSLIGLYDIIVDNSSGTSDYPTLSLLNTPLTISNDLTIEANTTMDASGLGLTIAGDFTNNGTFTPNANTTTFNGSGTQVITGTTTFYNLDKTSANTVQLAGSSDLTIQNNLNITSGTLDDNNNDITVSGTVTNTAIHTNTNGTKSNSGIVLAGSSPQDVIGAGTFSRIQVQNSSDVTLNNDIIITEQVRLHTGSLDIQGFQLTMNEDAVFFDASGGGFSSSKMVQTRRSFTDAGVIKVYNGTAASAFTYPIGSGDKYTPVVVTLTQNSETNATIAIRAADEPHPNVQEDVDSPEFVDQDNVLQYYWEVTSSGMTDFIGNLTFTYFGSDAYVTSPFTLNDYNTARLLPDASDSWNKLETGFNYQSRDGSNTLSFDVISATGDSGIGGDYTAGVDGAIPNQVQTVTSNVAGGSGNWTTDGSWDTNSAPRGAIVDILAGDEIIMDGPDLLAYKTVIDGTLTVSASATNARLGRVSGSGTLVISGGGNLPAGIYDDFFNCSTGGTLAFNDNDDYTLPDQIANLRNLLIDGTGTKSFPNTDITICNDLELRGGTTLNNDFNVSVEVLGNMTLTNGTLDLGTNTTFTVNGDVTLTAGTLDLGNNDLIILGDLILNGGTLVLGTNGTIDLEGDLTIGGTSTISGANSSNVNFAQNITKTSGTFSVDATTTTFTADGTGNQTISGDFTGAESFNRLSVNKSSGDLSIIDGGNDVEVDGLLTLTSQNIQTDGSNSLTLTSTASIAGGSSGSYVEGPLTKNAIAASANFTFPVGNSARFGYARIENVGTGGQNWTAEYFSSNSNSGQTIDITTNAGYGAMVEISTLNSWTITPSGSNTAIVELGVISGMSVQVIEDVRIAIYNGPTANEWVNLGGSPAGDESNGSITSQTASDFSSSTFSFGGITTVALPVELVRFTADLSDNQVKLDWTTSSELNNEYFEVQRSSNGENYEVIGMVDGNGTTNEFIDYQFVDDKPYYGLSYYRLVQVDYDGTRNVHAPVTVNNEGYKSSIEVSVFPNPAHSNNVNVRFASHDENSIIQISLFDLSGNLVHMEETTPSLGISDIHLNIRGEIQSGIYLVAVQQGNNKQIKRLSIR
ncbi:T9SS type A sorting domain-containing protein [Reichenbachiella sp.]|uniref:T9SS type A sorting domain-containing protein n=1 Tax=Reichenbachiella sp. TaxID=2184521 RepID=UPI003BB167B4